LRGRERTYSLKRKEMEREKVDEVRKIEERYGEKERKKN
jgi:hypothetical protein